MIIIPFLAMKIMVQLYLQQLQPQQQETEADNSNYAFFKNSWNVMPSSF